MNNLWVKRSRDSFRANLAAGERRQLDNHEIWLDAMNLHETSWMLFVSKERYKAEPFGWPRK